MKLFNLDSFIYLSDLVLLVTSCYQTFLFGMIGLSFCQGGFCDSCTCAKL